MNPGPLRTMALRKNLEVAEMTGLREGSIDHVSDLQGVAGTGDNTEMTDGEDPPFPPIHNEPDLKWLYLD